MRLFNNLPQVKPTETRSLKNKEKEIDGVVVENTGIAKGRRGRRLIKRSGPSNQPQMSAKEIRDKVSVSDKAIKDRQSKIELSTKETSSFMQEKPKVAIGDVGSNDPNSLVTVGKLKDLVRGGGFDFSDKERSVLANILKDR